MGCPPLQLCFGFVFTGLSSFRPSNPDRAAGGLWQAGHVPGRNTGVPRGTYEAVPIGAGPEGPGAVD